MSADLTRCCQYCEAASRPLHRLRLLAGGQCSNRSTTILGPRVTHLSYFDTTKFVCYLLRMISLAPSTPAMHVLYVMQYMRVM